jgi:hypothetical protein
MFVNSEVGIHTESILFGLNLANNLSICTQRFTIFSVSTQNSEVNNASNVITIQKANTKSSVGQHGRPTNAKVGSGPRRSNHHLLTDRTHYITCLFD